MKSFLTIVAIAALTAAVALLEGCIVQGKKMEFLERVEVKIDRVGVQTLGLTGTTLTMNTRIINRSDVNFSIDGIDYEIYYQGRLIGAGRDDRYFDIHKQSEDVRTFPVNASYADAVATFLTLGKDDVCLVKGTATTVSVAGKRPLEFAVEARFGGQ